MSSRHAPPPGVGAKLHGIWGINQNSRDFKHFVLSLQIFVLLCLGIILNDVLDLKNMFYIPNTFVLLTRFRHDNDTI